MQRIFGTMFVAVATAMFAFTMLAANTVADPDSANAATAATKGKQKQAKGKVAVPAKPNRRPAFRRYVACDTVIEARASRRCRVKDSPGAFFRSNRRSVRYSVCVKFPTGKALCARKQTAKKGELYVNSITTQMVGVHTVTWFVKGKKVGQYRFRVVRPRRS